jgi:Ca2+-binding EF-hand superfamily protein
LEQCSCLSKELGVDNRILKDCLAAQEDDNDDEEEGATKNRDLISFLSFESAVSAAQERQNREARHKERAIQNAADLDEDLFQEFRHDLLVLHALFQRFDVDQSGCLDYEEVEHLLKDFGLFPQDKRERAEAMRIVRSCDEDGSGTFDFCEFLGLVRKIRAFALQGHEDSYFCIFERYDRGGRGALNVAELSALLCTLGLVPRTRREQEELAHLILLADEDGSGTLDFGEFSTLCQRIIERMKRLRYEEEIDEALKLGFSHEETHELRWIFDRLDTSGNGLIDKSEAKAGIHMTKLPISREAFEESFRRLDTDRSGELDFMEFTHLMCMLRDREGMFKTAEDPFSYDDIETRRY